MNVHQLSIAYVPEQDRILVRVNTREERELHFWLTRRLALGLTRVLGTAVADQAARHGGLPSAHIATMDAQSKQAVAEFRQTETLRKADFSTPYQPPGSTPLFDGPLLVTEVQLAPLNNGQLRLSCSENLPGGAASRSFELALADQLMHAFVHLLERAMQQSAWRETASGTSVAATAPELADAPLPPAYLN
ncbi:MAG: hypothetical protein LH632_11480 [Rhodoferax sp.]|nr:hypothetical protein [Rhodoferax sp.]